MGFGALDQVEHDLVHRLGVDRLLEAELEDELRRVGVALALLVAVGGYVAIEAAFRRRLVELALRVTTFLAVVGALVLAVAYLPLLVVGAIAGLAIAACIAIRSAA